MSADEDFRLYGKLPRRLQDCFPPSLRPLGFSGNPADPTQKAAQNIHDSIQPARYYPDVDELDGYYPNVDELDRLEALRARQGTLPRLPPSALADRLHRTAHDAAYATPSVPYLYIPCQSPVEVLLTRLFIATFLPHATAIAGSDPALDLILEAGPVPAWNHIPAPTMAENAMDICDPSCRYLGFFPKTSRRAADNPNTDLQIVVPCASVSPIIVPGTPHDALRPLDMPPGKVLRFRLKTRAYKHARTKCVVVSHVAFATMVAEQIAVPWLNDPLERMDPADEVPPDYLSKNRHRGRPGRDCVHQY